MHLKEIIVRRIVPIITRVRGDEFLRLSAFVLHFNPQKKDPLNLFCLEKEYCSACWWTPGLVEYLKLIDALQIIVFALVPAVLECGRCSSGAVSGKQLVILDAKSSAGPSLALSLGGVYDVSDTRSRELVLKHLSYARGVLSKLYEENGCHRRSSFIADTLDVAKVSHAYLTARREGQPSAMIRGLLCGSGADVKALDAKVMEYVHTLNRTTTEQKIGSLYNVMSLLGYIIFGLCIVQPSRETRFRYWIGQVDSVLKEWPKNIHEPLRVTLDGKELLEDFGTVSRVQALLRNASGSPLSDKDAAVIACAAHLLVSIQTVYLSALKAVLRDVLVCGREG